MEPETYKELRDLFLSHFPNGELETDEDGQFIIYTGLETSMIDDEVLVSFGG